MMITFTQRTHYISLRFINLLISAVTYCAIFMILTGCEKEDDIDPLAPLACFEAPAGDLFVDISINFNAFCSKNAVEYQWAFNDGWETSQKEFTRTFSEPGNYTLSLTVTDSLGAIATDSKSFTIQASPYIIHEGLIDTEEIWEEGLHLIKNDVMINGGSVIIEPGAEIFVNKGKSIFIGDTFEHSTVSLFKAEGTADKPISFKPASGLDEPGEWGHLYFTPNTSPESSLVHCNISYGGKGFIYLFANDNFEDHGIISIEDCKIKIENTTIKGGLSHGIRTFKDDYYAVPGFTSFNNNTLTENIGHPIMIEMNGVHTIGINNNYPEEKGILVFGWNFLQEEETWKKQAVPYEIEDRLLIGGNSATGSYHLIIEPGVEITFQKEAFMIVESSGSLIAVGTASAPISFSSAEAVKAQGDWDQVKVIGQSRFEYCTFEYGGSGHDIDWPGLLHIRSEGTTVNNCTFRESLTDGLLFVKGDLTNSSNNVFSNCTRYGMTVVAHLAHLVNTSHTFNCDKNIHIKSTNTALIENVTWVKRNFPYYFSGGWSIQNNYNGTGSLTIAPGTEIRFLPEARISVYGAFIADGTSEPIILTIDEVHRADKSYYWKGIVFNSGTSADSKMINCKVSYGGNNPGYPDIGMIHCSSTSGIPALMDNEINNSAGHGISLDFASPVMSGNTFSGNTAQDVYTY